MKDIIDFDDYSKEYNDLMDNQLSVFTDDVSYFAEYKIEETKKTLKTKPKNILDFGCGVGRNINFFKKHFPLAKISGCDISQKSIDIAKKSFPESDFFVIEDIPKPQNFDLIFISNVFHHITKSDRDDVVKNILLPYLSDNGSIVVFEHNPINPVTRYLVATCPFDKDAELLFKNQLKSLFLKFGLSVEEESFTLFFPPSWKKFKLLENKLKKIPFGGQYFIHFKKK
jgi:SAM-dependent methyltransferase